MNIKHEIVDNTVLNNILFSGHPFRGAIAVSEAARLGFVSDYNVLISRFTTGVGGKRD